MKDIFISYTKEDKALLMPGHLEEGFLNTQGNYSPVLEIYYLCSV